MPYGPLAGLNNDNLFKAIRHNDLSEVIERLEEGWDVNEQDEYDSYATPLHKTTDAAIAKVLIEWGADVNARDQDGAAALHLASDGEVAKVLIDAGAELGSTTYDEDLTPLHYTGNFEVAKVLLESGADPLAGDCYGRTPYECQAALEGEGARSPELLDVLRAAESQARMQQTVQQSQASTPAIDEFDTPMRVPSPDPTPGQRSNGYSETAQEEESWGMGRF